MNISLYWNQKEFVFYLFLFIAYKYILSFCLAIKPCQCLEIDAIFDATINHIKIMSTILCFDEKGQKAKQTKYYNSKL